jgi:nicotinamide-nucleotide amidase
LILLPGVPNEMRTFFNEDILPYLEKHYPVKDFEKEEELHFCFLTESTLDGKLRLLSERFPTVKVGIYPTTGTCSVRLTGSEAKSFAAQLTEFFPTYLMPHAKPEMALHELLTERRLTIACAESCTGGMIAEKITAQPGASAYFLGSLVVYGNECKRDILGVSEQTLQQYGAVSQEVVAEMFQGLMKVTKADYGMAVTGIAGPSGGTLEKPVGTVWAAIGQRGEQPDLWTFRLELNREGIILLTSNRLLSALYRKIFFGIRGGQ